MGRKYGAGRIAGNRRVATLGQINLPFCRLGMLTIEKRGVADRADADAASLVGDAVAQLRALVALDSEEAELHQLVRPEHVLQLGEKCRRKPTLAEFQRGLERLAEAAEVGLLGTGEREVVHQKKIYREGRQEREDNFQGC